MNSQSSSVVPVIQERDVFNAMRRVSSGSSIQTVSIRQQESCTNAEILLCVLHVVPGILGGYLAHIADLPI